MNFKPILFSSPMILALLEGRKSQTRRIVKSQPEVYDAEGRTMFKWSSGKHYVQGDIKFIGDPFAGIPQKCAKGDVLWVREEHYAWGRWEDAIGQLTTTGKQKRKFVDLHGEAVFVLGYMLLAGRNEIGWHKRLGRFMPRKYARTFLEITDVRVERLGQISMVDAEAEGAPMVECGPVGCHICGFADIWKAINGPESWEANPWVWAISFKRIDKPEKFQ